MKENSLNSQSPTYTKEFLDALRVVYGVATDHPHGAVWKDRVSMFFGLDPLDPFGDRPAPAVVAVDAEETIVPSVPGSPLKKP